MPKQNRKLFIRAPGTIKDGFYFLAVRAYREHGVLYNHRLYNKHGRKLEAVKTKNGFWSGAHQ